MYWRMTTPVLLIHQMTKIGMSLNLLQEELQLRYRFLILVAV